MSTGGALTGKTLGRYRVGALLGRGGMGEVYRADDLELQRAVAIKVLPPALTQDAGRVGRFVQEARSASALNHPHLVAIYEIGEARPDSAGPTVHFIAMELVQGETLRRLIDARRTDLKRTLEYLAQAADALAAAHAAGIVHRDLKPDNLMVADGGYAKVLDFGLAKLRAEAPLAAVAANEPTVTRIHPGAAPGLSPRDATTPGVVMGTVGYMSPEQAQGLAIDHRADIFSFGCVLYEVATGARPFAAASAIDTLHQIIHVHPPPLAQLAPGAPPELQRIVRKCLAKNPDERYQSMKDLALDLRDLRRELDSGSSPAVAGAHSAPRARGRRAPWIAGAAVIAVGLAALALVTWLRRAAPPAAPAELMMERVTSSGLVIDAAISYDGKYITYVESYAGHQKLWLRQTSGGRTIELAATDGGFWGVTFNRDASAVYYSLKTTRDPGTLYSIPVLGGTPRPLLNGIDSVVTFSPDGSRLAYYRIERGGKGESSLMIAGADGSNPRPLVTKRPPELLVPAFFAAASWSPDGRWISAVVRNSASRDARLSLFHVDTGAEQSFPHRYTEATFTAWLPDSTGVVVVARLPGQPGSGNGGQLWLQPYPQGEVRRITNDLGEYRNVSITADGRSLLTINSESHARLSIAALDGTGERRLPEGRFVGVGGLAWAPDGRRIYYVKGVQRELQLWSMNVDGTNAREIAGRVRSGGVAATPDGRFVVFTADREGGAGIWRAHPDGTGAALVATDADPRWISLSPDGETVYFTSTRGGSPSTYGVPVMGGEVTLVAPLLERAVQSPDGRYFAGIYRSSIEAPYSIAVLDAATLRALYSPSSVALALQPLYSTSDVSIASGTTSVAWPHDGKTLLFTSAERINLWREPVFARGSRQQVTRYTDLNIARFALSPDGRTLLMCRGTLIRDAVLLTNFR